MIPIEDQLRSFPVPPRHVLITAAGEIERLRRDLASMQKRTDELEGLIAAATTGLRVLTKAQKHG